MSILEKAVEELLVDADFRHEAENVVKEVVKKAVANFHVDDSEHPMVAKIVHHLMDKE